MGKKKDQDSSHELTVGEVLDRHTGGEAQNVAVPDYWPQVVALVENSPATPYLTEMIEQAQRSGRPLEDVLAEDLEPLAAADVRTPDCLQPSEVGQMIRKVLGPQRQQHVVGCHYCRVQVQIAHPEQGEFGRLIRRMEQERSAEAAAAQEPRTPARL